MTQPADERQVCAEVRAALALIRRYRCAKLMFSLSSDRAGAVWLKLEQMEGIPLRALSDESLTNGSTLKG